jgi:nitrite reductase/ring-hydroxylating ferredoxin subunit
MAATWRDASAQFDLWDCAGLGLVVVGRAIVLFRVAAFATADLCTHGHARLCDGFIQFE